MSQDFNIGDEVVITYECKIEWCTTCPSPGDIGVIVRLPRYDEPLYIIRVKAMDRDYYYNTKQFELRYRKIDYVNGF